MPEYVYLDELTFRERDRILNNPFAEIRVAMNKEDYSCREVVKIPSLNIKSLIWLSKELGLEFGSSDLFDAVEKIEMGETVYTIHFKRKKNGDFRKLLEPDKGLKRIQRRILREILQSYTISPRAFGYSQGSIVDAIRPHLETGQQNIFGTRSIFMTDIENAFSNVRLETVFEELYGMSMHDSYESEGRKGYLSWDVVRMITELTMITGEGTSRHFWRSYLPQGAPTSPRLFDIVFYPIDQRLSRFADRIGGVYTRFADNIFFSMPTEEFPDKVARAVVRTIHEIRHVRDRYSLDEYRRFHCHKSMTRKLGKESVRILGLNIIDGEIHNTREFKRRVRLSIHRMNWLLSNTPDDSKAIDECWQTLKGQMSFAVKETLPPKIIKGFQALKHTMDEYGLN